VQIWNSLLLLLHVAPEAPPTVPSGSSVSSPAVHAPLFSSSSVVTVVVPSVHVNAPEHGAPYRPDSGRSCCLSAERRRPVMRTRVDGEPATIDGRRRVKSPAPAHWCASHCGERCVPSTNMARRSFEQEILALTQAFVLEVLTAARVAVDDLFALEAGGRSRANGPRGRSPFHVGARTSEEQARELL
jgi:hypothetical protein